MEDSRLYISDTLETWFNQVSLCLGDRSGICVWLLVHNVHKHTMQQYNHPDVPLWYSQMMLRFRETGCQTKCDGPYKYSIFSQSNLVDRVS